MPTYEYGCTACGQHIEVFQRFSEDALTTCGVCGGSLRKVYHPAGIVFKGSGFYATDSRSKKPTAAGAKKEGDTGSGAADSGSSDPGTSGSDSKTSGSDGKTSGAKPSSAGPSSSGDGGSGSKASTTTEAS